MVVTVLLAAASATVIAVGASCVSGKRSELRTPQEPQRKSGVTDFSDEGKLWFIGVSVRAARLTGPQEMLPLNLVLVNKTAGPATVSRESFSVEMPDGTLLPVVSYDEFEQDYRRDRSDLRAGEEYVQRFTQRFSAPPFTWRELEFFPLRNSAVVARSTIDTRNGELLHGYLYFRSPSERDQFPEGRYKLLFQPRPGDDIFVVEFYPY
jgi:hypothetical protein